MEYEYIGSRVARRKYPVPDVKYDITYDNYGRAIQHYTYTDSNDITDFLYTFDDNGNITDQLFAHRSPSPSNSYAYDNLDRLTQAMDNRAPQSGLTSYWKLDEISGSIACDSSGYGHVGTLIGDPVWNSNGVIGGVLEFDGDGDYIEIEGYQGICGGQPRTVTAWVKTDDGGDIVSWGNNQPDGNKWRFRVTGKLKGVRNLFWSSSWS